MVFAAFATDTALPKVRSDEGKIRKDSTVPPAFSDFATVVVIAKDEF